MDCYFQVMSQKQIFAAVKAHMSQHLTDRKLDDL